MTKLVIVMAIVASVYFVEGGFIFKIFTKILSAKAHK